MQLHEANPTIDFLVNEEPEIDTDSRSNNLNFNLNSI
jgi:hypothetical protein